MFLGRLRRFGFALACGLAVWGPAQAGAQEPQPQSLQERIEKLERQNQQLMQMLCGAAPGAVPTLDFVGVDGPGQVSKNEVQKIVGAYLKAQEAEKKSAADKKKQQEMDAGTVVGKDLSMKARWSNGFVLETEDKAFRTHVGGRVQPDWGWFAPDANLEPRGWNDGAFFRRVRLRVDGSAWEVINWQAELDFAATSPTIKDTFMEITKLPYAGTFRAGHFYEPFSLENWGTSDNWITFIERASVIDALDPERNMGMLFYNNLLDERVFWGIGLFRPNSTEGNGFASSAGDGEYSYTGRLTFNPIYSDDGRCWLHLGGAYSYRSYIPVPIGTINNPIGDDLRYRSRIPTRAQGTTFVNAERVIDTGALNADSVQLFNLQAAMAAGPFSLQGEFMASQVHDLVRGPQRRDPSFWGYYVLASYFLTGEHRPYLRKIGGIGAPVPHEPFFFVKAGDGSNLRNIFGRGAWELCLRYGYTDLGSPSINAIGAIPPTSVFQGHLHDVTVGLNWYLNTNFRIMWNYTYSHVNGLEVSPTTQSGDVHALGMRFSFWF